MLSGIFYTNIDYLDLSIEDLSVLSPRYCYNGGFVMSFDWGGFDRLLSYVKACFILLFRYIGNVTEYCGAYIGVHCDYILVFFALNL